MRSKFVQIIKATPRVTVASGKLIWKRLPYIAVYTLAFAVLIGAGQFLYQKYDYQRVAKQPGTDFINYTSFTVNNAREGEDITFTLCRTHDKNYDVHGTRTVYVVPEGKTEAQKVFIYNKQVTGVVDSGNCQPYFIKQSEFHFNPGKYLVTLNLGFNVQYGIGKSVFVKSNIFTIYAQPDGGGDVQTQLNNLQERFNDLLDQFNALQLRTGGSPTTIRQFNETTPSSTSQPVVVTPPANVTNNTTNNTTTPAVTTPTPKNCTIDIFGAHLFCQ